MQNNKIYGNIYNAMLIFLALSTVMCVCNANINTVGASIYLLPLTCMICFLLFRNIKKTFGSLSIMTICIVSVIRYGLYPLSICLEKSNGSYYVAFSQNAISLMLYEMVIVFLFLNLYSKRIHLVDNRGSMIFSNNNLTRINQILFLSVFPLAMAFPSLLGFFSFFGIAKSNVPISGVIAITFKVGLYIGYLYLLSKCSNNGKGGFFNLLIAFIVAASFIFLIAFGESNVSRWAFLWIGIPTLMILANLFPNHKRAILSFSCLALPFGIIAGSFVKFAVSDFSVASFFSNFISSESLSEYFGGLNGLTFAMQTVAQDPRAGTMYSTLTDLLCSTPLLSSFFDFENYSTQSIHLDYLNRTDLICPLLGQSYAHFGFWGAPIFSILFSALAIEFERVSMNANDVYLKYASLSLCITFSLFMCLNTIIIMSNAWVLIMFLLVQLYNNRTNKYAFNNSSNV